MKIGFIGGGKMAEAIIRGLVSSGTVAPDDVVVSDISEERCALLRDTYGASICSDNRALALGVDVLFLAVKPQGLDAVLADLAPVVDARHLVISIAAGKSIAGIAAALPAARVVRVMPNLPATVGEGMSVFYMGPGTSAVDGETVTTLLSCFGEVLELPEDQFDAVTAVSGSGPAFFAHVLALIIDAGTALGLAPSAAAKLATQTMLGTARLLTEQPISPAELVTAVCSKGGATEAGMRELDAPALADILWKTLKAAADRSRELSA
jgi:pyrroline-5-carboxylate reductase